MKFKTLFSTLLLMFVVSSYAQAQVKTDFEKPIFIKGANLDQNQLEQTKDDLDVKNENDYEVLTINADEVNKYLGTNLNYITSSATIEKKKFGKGVDVEILTPNTITKVTNEQYMNASITAGINNANIKVASVESVTGEGALTGIYKAYEESGNELDKQDIQNANQEMSDLAAISEENQGKDGYSDESLNAAIADIKQQLADIQKKQDEQLTKEQVSDIVNDVLKDRGLNNVINEQQTTVIINNMYNVTQGKVFQADPKAFEQQAKSVSKKIEKSAGDLINKAKDLNTEENRTLLQKIIDGIKEIFLSLVDFIKGIFN
ncbi:DUF1002 domain-containing protein [Mammaliicoccus sciuri]|uniref:DUF1002 domain-containing protein n=1 Tax=Mammaliicoccus sciuri TaxID=1296 RepID=UPI00374E3E14